MNGFITDEQLTKDGHLQLISQNCSYSHWSSMTCW